MSNEQVLEWNGQGLLAEVVGYETDEVALSAAGSTVQTYLGGEFLDFTSGIAVHACGHNSADVVAAIREQAGAVIHTSDVLRHAPQLKLAHFLRGLLAEIVPGEPWTFQFMNSGSESIDTAAKLALKATGRSRFVAFQGAFHGRTLFASALSLSNLKHRQAYAPFLSHIDEMIYRAPAPRPASSPARTRQNVCVGGLEAILDAHGSEIAAIFFEAQQGEGGYFPMPAEIGGRIRQLADRHGVLLIADEIQSGFGRTGRWFGFERLGIRPDIVVFGKAVGGGLPLAGIAAPAGLMERWSPGEHGTTFGGNPIACAAGLAALESIQRDNLVTHAEALGEEIKARLCLIVGKHGVYDVRGNGLMIGIELRDSSGNPDHDRVTAVKLACRDMGMLLLSCGAKIGLPTVDNSTLRLLPPLNISREELYRGIAILEKALAAEAN